MDGCGCGLRRRGPRTDGAHEPADPVATQRPGERDDPRAATDGGPPRAGGRFVNYDPQTYASWSDGPQGIPDLNIIPGLPSVSGYASIVNSNYQTFTHTHQQGDLDIGELASGTLDRLDLREIVTIPEYFLVPLSSDPVSLSDVHQMSEGFGSDPVLARGFSSYFNDTAYPFYPGPRPSLRSGHTQSWYFGESLEPTSATVLFTHASTSDALVRFGIVTPDGSTRWGPAVSVTAGASRVTGRVPGGEAVGLSVQAVGSLPPHQALIAVSGQTYELDGSLSTAVVPDHWSLAGSSQGYAVYTSHKPPAPITASTSSGRPLAVTVVSSTTKSEEIRLDAPASSSVVRSVAWDAGWRATVSVNGGPARAVSVNSYDLVQRVHLPPGHDVVTFHYRPTHLTLATVLSLGAIGVLLVLLVGWLVRRRRRQPAEPDVAPVVEYEPEAVPI